MGYLKAVTKERIVWFNGRTGCGEKGWETGSCGSFNGSVGGLVDILIHGIQSWLDRNSGACGALPMSALAPWRRCGVDVEARVE